MYNTELSYKWTVAMVAAVCLASAAALPGLAAEANGSLPEFRKLSSDAQIAEALKAVEVDAWIENFAAGKGAFPECGGYVKFLTPGSPSSELPVPLGSVVEWQRSQRYLHFRMPVQMAPDALGNPADKLVWVTPDNQRHELKVPPGKLGFRFGGLRNMPNWYLRHGNRDSRWDRHVLLALERQGRDPEVSETCWAIAFEQGYRADKLSSWSGMMLSLMNGDYARAAGFAEAVIPFEANHDPESLPIAAGDVYRLALWTGDPRWFHEIKKSMVAHVMYSNYPHHMPDFVHQKELAAGVPPGTPPPSELADKMKRTSFLADADTSDSPWLPNDAGGKKLLQVAATAQIKGKEEFRPFSLNAPVNIYRTYFFSPAEPSRDLDVEIRYRVNFHIIPDDKSEDESQCDFVFGLVDRTPGKVQDFGSDADSRILLTSFLTIANGWDLPPSWDIAPNGKVPHWFLPVWQCAERDPSPLLIPTETPFRHDPNEYHTLRIVRVGRQAEALLDGRRLALVHVPDDLRNPGLQFRVTGCNLTVTSLKADALK